MPIAHFTVSQVRVAAACPRILYFDAEHTRRHGLKQPSISRIWKTGEQEATACGSLFHAAIEQFNHHALAEPMVRRIVESDADAPRLTQELLGHIYDHHVNRAALFEKTGAQQQAFLAALRCYVGELADILAHARSVGKPIAEVLDEMFGDRRRRVDVTFDVGPADEPVHVTGILDYVFYDWRTTHNRIIDYKLTPPDKHAEDLFQVSLYALMHHVQHRTEPDVGVLYLYPKRQMIEKSWEQVHGERHKVYNLLASMREWVRYDEQTGQGLKPPGEPLYCNVCRWRDQCVERLGPKHEGQRLTHWTDALAAAPCAELPVAAHEPGPVAKAEADEGPTVPAEPPEDALWIGETAARRPVALPLAALPTHVAVIGAAGSGKTWVAKVLAEEAVGQGVPVLALDPQGDLVQLMKPRDPASFAGELRRRYDRFWERAEPRILTPGSSHGIRL
ncbi:MAG TPA: helicase HerA-like domain-containing protein, partial [Gemmataceae bacterium]|nr:helicase HerA-like domain-containing protein [Gemmataceae bacterium]